MLTWARAEIFHHQHSLPMLAPQWTQPKIGPMLRREKDLRYYTGLFRKDQYVSGLRKLWLLKTAERIPEENAGEFLKDNPILNKNFLIEFAGLGDFFEPLLAHRDYLNKRIERVITPQVEAEIDNEPIDFEIACHIRRGDKPTMKLGESINPEQWHNALPMTWFVNVIQSIREALGHEAKVCVFSDGRDDQLEECLALPGVRRAQPKSAIADIIAMSKGRMLITTGTSTFSYWAAFLGGMPTFWYPSLVQKLSPTDREMEIETGLLGEMNDSDRAKLPGKLNSVVNS